MDIVIDILKNVESEGVILKTHLLYRANLNSRSLEKFLRKLVAAGLLNVKSSNDGRRKYYQISLKGRYVLKRLLVIRKMLNEEDKLFNNILEVLKRSEALCNVKVVEGVRINGSSGITYAYSLALVSMENKDISSAIAVEVIDENSDLNEVVERISIIWLASLDSKTKCVIIIPRRVYDQVLKFVNNICVAAKALGKYRPTIIPYNNGGSLESIISTCIKSK